MKHTPFLLIVLLALLGKTFITPVLGQDATTYTDPAEQFTITIPVGWTDESTSEYGLFTNNGFELYALSVADPDVQAAVDSAVAQISSLFEGVVPNQMGDVPSPSGVWTQAMYNLPDSTIAITVAQANSEATVILVAHMESMGQLQALSADVQAIIASVKIEGVIVDAPEAAPTAAPLPTAEGEIDLPAPTGPYAVGQRAYVWVDETRDEAYTPEEDDKRSVAVTIWYPAAETSSEPAPYLSEGMNALFVPILDIDAAQVHGHSYADAPAAQDGPYSVLVFSPGNGMNSALYAGLFEEIASHGYIVVAADHSYNALFTTLSDGQVLAGLPAAQDQSEDDFQARVADVEFVIDQLAVLNADEENGLADMLDLDHLALFGHSFGGATVAETCRLDGRCDAVLSLDGPLQGTVSTEGLAQPILFMDSERLDGAAFVAEAEQMSRQDIPDGQIDIIDQFNQYRDDAAVLVGKASSGAYHMFIAGTRHGSFTDIPFMVAIQPAAQLYMGGLASIEAERGWRIISDYSLAFFDMSLKGETGSLLQSASEAYPEVEISTLSD